MNRFLLRPNFLEDLPDIQTLLRAVRKDRRIVSIPSLKRLLGRDLSPWPYIMDIAQMKAFIRQRMVTTYHPLGT